MKSGRVFGWNCFKVDGDGGCFGEYDDVREVVVVPMVMVDLE